ncbi:unnamed protein product [Trichobilharzia szidati]|nr:unnamed protein product [Trichobilharzia szidati]
MSLRCSKNSSFVFDDSSCNDLELIHFRLTDSALKDIEQLASSPGNHSFKITFNGSEGSFVVPVGKQSSRFTFGTSSVTSTHDESVNCLRIRGNSTQCLGKMSSRITVNAKEDSFSAAKERMTQLEDENKKSQTKELGSSKTLAQRTSVSQSSNKRSSPCVNSKGKGNEFPSQNADVPNLNRVQSQNPAGCGPSPPLANPEVSARSLRERIIHILALRPYQRPELLLRLSRDGLSRTQKDQISDILSAVGRVGRQSAYYLLPSVISELDCNWPGYTGAERKRIMSLKTNQLSQTSPKSPADRSRTASPDNSSTPSSLRVSDDQFTRRPTRANAPSAPHALSKKIAALDMLCAGVSDVEVAARLGVFRGLLDQWRANESELRERYRRLNANSDSAPSTQISNSTQNSQANDKSLGARLSNPPTSTSNDVVNNQRSNSSNAGDTISPHKRARLDVPNTSSGSTDLQQMELSYPTSDKSMSRCVMHSFSNRSHDENSQSGTISPPLHDNLHTLDTYNRSSQPCTYNTAGGSEGESAEHTPFSNSSTGSSGYGGSNNGLTASSGIVHNSINNNSSDIRRGGLIEPMSHDRSASRGHLTASSAHHSEFLSSRLRVEDQLTNGNMPTVNTAACGKTQQILSQNVVETDYQTDDLSNKLAEIDRLYPQISTPEQASMYLAEFECTYPTYLRMYHSFSDIWKTVSNLRTQLLEATKTEGLDSANTTHLANQLDKFMRRSRTPKYREDEIQLTLMVHKLRLLKQRLADSRHSTAAAAAGGGAVDNKVKYHHHHSRSNSNHNVKSLSSKSLSSVNNKHSHNANANNNKTSAKSSDNHHLMNNCNRKLLSDLNDCSNLLQCNQV